MKIPLEALVEVSLNFITHDDTDAGHCGILGALVREFIERHADEPDEALELLDAKLLVAYGKYVTEALTEAASKAVSGVE
jgi:hypothetical protein